MHHTAIHSLHWDEGGGARLLVVSAQAEGLGDSAWRSWLVVQDEEVGGWMDREGIPMWKGQGGWRRDGWNGWMEQEA